MFAAKNEGLLFRKARLKWNFIFTLTIAFLFLTASSVVYFLFRNINSVQFDNELIELSSEVEKRVMNLPTLIREKMLSLGENRPLLYLSEEEVLQIYDLEGKKVYDIGIDFPEPAFFKEGFSEQNEFRFYTKIIKNVRGIPMMFVRIGKSEKEFYDNQQSFFNVLFLLFLVIVVGSWILSNFLSFYILRPLKTSYEQLKRFTSDASHELKTPLSVLRTSIDLLPVKELTEPVKEKISYMDNAVRKMQNLVDQLIRLAKSEQPSASVLRTEIIQLNPLFRTLVEQKQVILEQKCIHVEIKVEPEERCVTSKEILLTILNNLFDNAIKFTKNGGNIALGMMKRGRECLFYVEDNGIGIPETEYAKIFQRFYKVENSRNELEGSGMGLAIVQEYARIIDAEVTVKSQLGQGSRFEFVFHEKK
jgi:signal transduction histidine kinase